MIDLHETLKPLVKRVVDAAHSSFPAHHSKEDTASTLWLWVMENENTAEDILLNNESWEGTLYHLMKRAANAHLKKEDAAIYGYSPEDVFNYTTEQIETILEVVFDYEDWQSFAMKYDSQPRAKAQANRSGDHLAMYADVTSSFSRLTDKQYNAIVWRFKYHYTFDMIGAEEGVSKQAASDRVNSGIKAIQQALGGKPFSQLRNGYEGRSGRPGRAEAEAVTIRDYEG